jgi:hypothetical protein
MKTPKSTPGGYGQFVKWLLSFVISNGYSKFLIQGTLELISKLQVATPQL